MAQRLALAWLALWRIVVGVVERWDLIAASPRFERAVVHPLLSTNGH